MEEVPIPNHVRILWCGRRNCMWFVYLDDVIVGDRRDAAAHEEQNKWRLLTGGHVFLKTVCLSGS